MIRESTKHVFITDDGQEFDSREAAVEHVTRITIEELADKSGIYWRDSSASEVAEFVLNNWPAIKAAMDGQKK